MKQIKLIFIIMLLVLIGNVNAYSSNNLIPSTICYQESANVKTSCGGLDNGSYSKTISFSSSCNSQGYNYFDINYTKNSIFYGAIWQIKQSDLQPYNTTIPTDCFNNTNLQLRINMTNRNVACSGTYTLQPQCYNGTNWINIGILSQGVWGGTTSSTDSYNNLFDGNWNTGGSSTYSSCTTGNTGFSNIWSPISPSTIYEEAIIWNVTNQNFTSENLTFTSNSNLTRYLSIPSNTILTNGFLNLSGTAFGLKDTEDSFVIATPFGGNTDQANMHDQNWGTYGTFYTGSVTETFTIPIVNISKVNITQKANAQALLLGSYVTCYNYTSSTYLDSPYLFSWDGTVTMNRSIVLPTQCISTGGEVKIYTYAGGDISHQLILYETKLEWTGISNPFLNIGNNQEIGRAHV